MTTYILFIDGQGAYARYDYRKGETFTTSDPDDAYQHRASSRKCALEYFERNFSDGKRYRDSRMSFTDRNLHSYSVYTLTVARRIANETSVPA